MKTISVYALQRNITKALEELPFGITRYGKLIAKVVGVSSSDVTLDTSGSKTPVFVEQLTKKAELKGYKLCPHNFPLGLCKKGCK